MPISIDVQDKVFSIHTLNSTYQFKVDSYGHLLHLYYGAPITGSAEYLLQYFDRGFSGNPSCIENDRTYSLDVLPMEIPAWGNSDYRSPSVVIESKDGIRGADFKYQSYTQAKGKYSLPGLPAVYAEEAADSDVETLEIVLVDELFSLEMKLLYGVIPELDIITRAVQITNKAGEEVYIDKLMPASLDFIYGNYDLITFHGRHTMERQLTRTEITHVSQSIGSRRGASSHQYNPMLIIADRTTTDVVGGCYAMEFVYSGGFQAEAEMDQFGLTRVQMGLQEEGFHYPLYEGEAFTSPEVILTYSNQGLDKLSHNLHDCIRKHLFRGSYKNRRRPVIINSWEAAYMNINREVLLDLAKEAAAIGIDMLVMDDGWFGDRNDDYRALGDWNANEEKLGCTLGELVQSVNELGIKFGIWMEPEMVSENSHLYEAHPDWTLKIPGRGPVRARDQLVLDFSRSDVRNYIYNQICKVVEAGNIEYVKWDYNRGIYEAYSSGTREQGRVLYDYVLGLYEVLDRLNNRYPELLIESCSGGGGRFDAGMLYYTPQVWTSDNTDPIDRLEIQYGTSFGYPVASMAAHVSKSPNEQTGRITPFHTRGITAMYGSFGYELDLGKLSVEEKLEAKKQIEDYHRYEELINNGLYYRLSNPALEKFGGWSFVSRNQEEVLVNVVIKEIHSNDAVNYMKLKGLKPAGVYREVGSGRLYSSDLLMNAGMPLPVAPGEYLGYQYYFVLEEA